MQQTAHIVVMDMDEILVDTAPEVYHKIRMHWPKFSMFLKDLGPLSYYDIMNRPYFNVEQWLLKDEYKDNKEAIKIVNSLLLKYVFNSDIYNDLEPTEFARRSIMNPSYIDNSAIKNIYILSRVLDGADIAYKSKVNFIQKYFKHDKIKPILFYGKKSKGEILREQNINWGLFIDDEVMNILAVIKEFSGELGRREFLMPNYEYNKISNELSSLIESEHATINRFDVFK